MMENTSAHHTPSNNTSQINDSSIDKISLATATIICMNAMIGAGIFATPAKLATTVGPAGILTYLFVITAVFFMALSLARVAQYYPQAGSFYTYAKAWGGHSVGILAAGSYIVGVVIALGLLAQIAAEYLHTLYPMISMQTYGIILIAIITGLNILGVKIVQIGQYILLSCTLFALFSTIILCLMHANTQNVQPFMPYGWTSLAKSTSAAIFAFFGFESATSLFKMVHSPEKNVPRALIISLLLVGAVYIAFIGSIMLAIPASTFSSAHVTLPAILAESFPQYSWIARIIGIAILTAIIGVLQSMMYSVSALTESFIGHLQYSSAQQFLSKSATRNSVTKKDSSFRTIVLSISALILVSFFVLQNKGIFFNLTALCVVLAFGLSIFSLIANHHNKTVWQKLTTYLGLVTAIFICISAIAGLLSEFA